MEQLRCNDSPLRTTQKVIAMTTIEKIKAEIERLYDGEAPKHDQQCNFDDGYFVGIDTIAQFLDTLESEKPINQEGLEEEINRYLREECSDDDEPGIHEIAEHFAEWGYLRAAEKFDEIEYNRQRAEEKQINPEGLDFQTFAKEMYPVFALPKERTVNTEENPLNWEYEIARHFAQWGAEHLKK